MLVQAKDPADEIDFITNRIEELVKKDGYRLPGYRPGLRGSSGIWPGDHEKL